MRATPRAVVGYIAGWLIMISFVVLLTLIFSFLGTIICAALAGMMMGAARMARWQSLGLSLIFPGVISTVLRVSRAELPGSQILFLSALCFGIFWAIYFAMRALVSQERTQESGTSRVVVPASVTPAAAESTVQCSSTLPSVGERLSSVPAHSGLTLEILQGQWSAEHTARDAAHHQKRMEISAEGLVVTLRDASGRIRFVGRAHLKLSDSSLQLVPDSGNGRTARADGDVSI